MNKNLEYPKVLLVGRTNVGKSTLFNRLTDEKKSIVFEREGVTRDYIHEVITWGDKTFDLVDTGGLTFKKHDDIIWKRIQEKVMALLNSAAIILFVCDGKHGFSDEDRVIATILHKTHKPVFLLINKCDNTGAYEDNLPEFYQLGFKTILPVSAVHGKGVSALLSLITETLTEEAPAEIATPAYKVVIIGKPNVGKSSLMNLLINQERSIVSNIAGTTREAVTETLYHCSDLVQLTDTAGVRRQARVTDDLEELMVKSSLSAIRDADIVLVMMDASEGQVSDQELKLLFYAYEQRKMVIAIFNKVDLITEYTRTLLEQSLKEYEFILCKIPQIWTSCITHKNVSKIFDEIQKVWHRATQHFKSTYVDDVVKEALTKIPLYHTGIQLKLFKIRHVKATIPTFVLHVNHPLWFGQKELGCIENILRRNFDLKGCPIQFSLKEI